MSNLNVNGRDIRKQFWVQSTKPALEGKLGTTFSLSNGYLGLRGAHEEMPAWGRPEFYIAGTYTGGPPALLGFHDPDHILTHPDRMTPEILNSFGENSISTLPNFPNPAAIRLTVGGVPFSHEESKILTNERLLNTEQALLRRRLVFRDEQGRRTCVDSQRFVSFANSNLICLQYKVTRLSHDAEIEIEPYIKTDVANTNGVVLWSEVSSNTETRENGRFRGIECQTDDTRLSVYIAQRSVETTFKDGKTVTLFIIAGELSEADAIARAEESADKGFEQCLAEHAAAYQAELAGAGVEFDSNAPLVQGFNFGQMHLQMAFCRDRNDVGVPIKGLTGHGYRFANFWDTDFHMFPYYLLTKPRHARRLLEYRYNQLEAYKQNARKWGAKGAQVPWETQQSGEEVTAPWLCLQDREIHISADAAYMFKLYDDLTPDHDAMVTMGAEFTFETARFFASRIRWIEQRGRFELPDIGCPDQYHTFADNNIFISLFAKWNLEQAIALAGDNQYTQARQAARLDDAETEQWRKIVDNFYIPQPNEDGIIEEFDGFFELSPDIDGISETFCKHSQAVKQCDVLAAFGPFEHLYPEEIRRKNWHFYAERTLHGSSLSLPGMAYAAARCGLNDQALDYLQQSARMDLDDVNLDTERGVHVSGGAVEWEAVVLGFGGLYPQRQHLHFRPNLPRQWDFLEFTAHWQFQRVRVKLTLGAITFEAAAANERPVKIKVYDQPEFELLPGKTAVCPVKGE